MSFSFGKYAGSLYEDIKKEDPEYLQFIATKFADKYPEVAEFVKKHDMLNKTFITFGKYKGEAVIEVYKKDKKYLGWIVNKFEEKSIMTKKMKRIVDEYKTLQQSIL